MDVIATANTLSEYRIEMVLLLYSIVIGFSFNIFGKERLNLFQYFTSIAAILYLSGRMFSLWIKFGQDHESYHEILFFLDILIMVFFYRSLAKVNIVNDADTSKIANYQAVWFFFAVTMFFTTLYRVIYAGISWHNLPQLLSILYCSFGIGILKVFAGQDKPIEKIERFQLVYSGMFFLGAVGYCIMRFQVLDF